MGLGGWYIINVCKTRFREAVFLLCLRWLELVLIRLRRVASVVYLYIRLEA